MDRKQFTEKTKALLNQKTGAREIASALRSLWLTGETVTKNLVKKEARDKIDHQGISVEVLKTIGQETGKAGKTDVSRFAALSELLWNEYGREGRIVATHILGALNETNPELIVPLCRKLARSCISWEECDNMTYGIEPVVRKNPKEYLEKLAPWLEEDNKWVKRAALNVIARLPMKQPGHTKEALSMIVPCLTYADHDVRRTCSFAIRLSARGDIGEVKKFLAKNLGGNNPTKIWIFSDAIRSMTKAFLPGFKGLLPAYRQWRTQVGNDPSAKSLDAAISILEKAG